MLELRPASFAARALGLLLDVVANIVLLIVMMSVIASAYRDLDGAAARALVLVSVVFCFVILPVAVETLTRGLSLGKLAAGLRIVRDDGGAIRFRHAVIRGLIGFLEIYLTFGGLAIAVALFNDKSKRLGDVVAGTYSLRRRVPAEAPFVPFVPPHLRSWSALADIGRIPDAVARRAAQFIRQAGRMSPAFACLTGGVTGNGSVRERRPATPARHGSGGVSGSSAGGAPSTGACPADPGAGTQHQCGRTPEPAPFRQGKPLGHGG